jgi:hypothetical protein
MALSCFRVCKHTRAQLLDTRRTLSSNDSADNIVNSQTSSPVNEIVEKYQMPIHRLARAKFTFIINACVSTIVFVVVAVECKVKGMVTVGFMMAFGIFLIMA